MSEYTALQEEIIAAPRRKYNNRPVIFDGFRFDSQREANHYKELKLLLAAGKICELSVHPRFELQPAFKHGGKTIRAVTYEADFQYQDVESGAMVIEDVKGVETAVFQIKRRLFLYKFPGIDFRIVK